MRLLVVRHAIAMEREDYQAEPGPEAGSRDDAHRPLTLEGLRKMRANAEGLRRLVEEPDLFLTSPFTRALQTCEILQKAWPKPPRFEVAALEPGSHPEKFVDWFRAHRKFAAGTAVVVGHEPHLSSLIAWLLSGTETFTNLKKGGACLIEFSGAPRKSRGELRWLVTPKLLTLSR